MALQQTIVTPHGFKVDEAYIRIDTISGNKNEIVSSVNSYTSQQAFLEGSPYLEQKFYIFTPDVSPNAPEMWTQGYNYLKTLSEYTNAIDVFE